MGEHCAGDAARRVALLIEYDGSAYRGSQYQGNGSSIQQELESAVEKLTTSPVRLALAGRTDAGVHALGQIAAFDTACDFAPNEIVRGLNHFLPDDIAVRAAADVASTFDPRRDAVTRVYRYVIDNRRERSPLTRGRAWHVRKPLAVDAMRRVADRMVGRHDFASFSAAYEGSTLRALRRCDVSRRRTRIAVTMESKAFLPQQVRRTVGVLVQVGHERMSEDAALALLREPAACRAEPVAPACGLYLVRVAYDGLDLGPCIGGKEGG